MGDTLSENNWTVYIIKCGDGTYYTGISNDVSRRLEEHKAGKGAKYLRGGLPLEIIFQKRVESHGTALKYESKIKKLTRRKKEELISNPSLLNILSPFSEDGSKKG